MRNMKPEDEMPKRLAPLHDDDTTLQNPAPERLLAFCFLHDSITSDYTTRPSLAFLVTRATTFWEKLAVMF